METKIWTLNDMKQMEYPYLSLCGALCGLGLGRLGFCGVRGGGGALLLQAHLRAVVLLVELLEGRRIHLDNGVLHQRLRAHLRSTGNTAHFSDTMSFCSIRHPDMHS